MQLSLCLTLRLLSTLSPGEDMDVRVLGMDSEQDHRERISRQKTQMSQSPLVRRVMKTSPRKWKKP